MLRIPRKHFAPRVRNLCQEIEHGRIFSLVHLVYALLASGFAGDCAVPYRLAHHIAVPHCRHRSAWCFCSARSSVFPSCTGFARSAGDLKTDASAGGSAFRVSPDELLIFVKKRLRSPPKLGGIASTHAVEISVETRSPAKCAISKRLRYFQPFCRSRCVSIIFTATYVHSTSVDRRHRDSSLQTCHSDICTALQRLHYKRV